MYCVNCARNISRPDNIDGKICCPLCGRVLDEDNFSQEPTFSKNAAGQSQLSGNFVRGMNEFSASRERTLAEARDVIESIMYALGIDGGGSITQAALRFYEIALDRNFTRGRRKEHVGAACLYIACREDKKPYLLIDFSEYLTINVYVLGAVFLQLCKLLSLEEHPIVQKPVDPSLFIHRFTDRLFGGRKPDVSRTALHIIASMKRDWMQTGRKPSGLCGAALYISALSHGVKRSKSEIIRIVHICEATLTKRLIEFESTDSGSLTIDEFTTKAEELEKEERSTNFARSKFKAYGISELLCEHKGSGKPHIAHGLCEDCYTDFFKLSGGLDGGSEPPAFQRAEMERIMAKEAAAQISENVDPSILRSQTENYGELLNSNKKGSIKNVIEYGDSRSRESDLTGATLQHDITHDSSNDGIHQGDATFEETETLSDIEDAEVDGYLLHNEEEKRLRKTIWEELNKEYLEEQAVKEAAAEAIRKANEARFKNCSEDVRAAHELAEAAKASVAKSKKEKQQKRAAELKNMGPAQSALEATKLVLGKKRLSSRIRYDVLDKLFEEPDPETMKKSRTDSNDNSYMNKNNEDPETETIENAYFDNVEEENYEDFFDDF